MNAESLFPAQPATSRRPRFKKKIGPACLPEPIYTLARIGPNLETVFEQGTPPWEGEASIEPPKKLAGKAEIIAVLSVAGNHHSGLFGDGPGMPCFGKTKTDPVRSLVVIFSPDGFVVAAYPVPGDFPRRLFRDRASLVERVIPAAIRHRIPASLQTKWPKPPRPQPA